MDICGIRVHIGDIIQPMRVHEYIINFYYIYDNLGTPIIIYFEVKFYLFIMHLSCYLIISGKDVISKDVSMY